MTDHPTLEQALEPLLADLPILFRVLLLILMIWATFSVMLAGFAMLFYGPIGAAAVMRATFAMPLRWIGAQLGTLLLTLPGRLVQAGDRLLRALVRLLLGRRP